MGLLGAVWLSVVVILGPQELYQSLAEAARSCDLEKLLSISDAHLTELSCINAVGEPSALDSLDCCIHTSSFDSRRRMDI